MRRAIAILSLLPIPLLWGCDRTGRDLPVAGVYRAVMMLPGGELPFGLEVVREDDRVMLYLINAAERIEVPEVRVEDGKIEALFPGFENTLNADMSRDRFEGEVTLIKAGGATQVIPFAATLGESYRFYRDPATDNADVSGRWAATFMDESGDVDPAIAEFTQTHDHVSGTFLTPTGDHRFLQGQVRGNELRLSTFDGAHAYLYHARVNDRGELVGEFWAGTRWHETWHARRDEAASLLDAEGQSRVADATDTFEFTFPDVTGKQVSSDDARFGGKVVVVAIGGSWCPNCHDEAAFLAPLYKRYRDAGLEVVGLMFEYSEDFDAAARAAARFRDQYEIEYPTLIAGISDKDDASRKLPALDHVYAYPTTVFIDRSGVVRKIHTGFAGPATGEHYEALKRDFEDTIRALLAERGPGSDPDDGASATTGAMR
jgi:thiol-disulfide isomerase/thioredoxin